MQKFSCKMARALSLSLASSFFLSLSPAQPPSQDVPLLKRIRDYWKEGDFALAKKQIRVYLEKNPTSSLNEELHLLLGDLYVQEGNFASALEEYDTLKNPELKEKSFYNKALCLYETKQYKELLSLTELLPSQKQLTIHQKQSVKYLCAVSLQASDDPSVFHNAVSLFESCKNTPFAIEALSHLISLHLSRGEEEKAGDCYLDLAKLKDSEAPDLLFQAATLKAKNNPSLSLELFRNVLCSSSTHKSAAAYNVLVLLYQDKQFKEAVSAYEETSLLFSAKEKEEASYLLGKSLYHLQEHEKALEPLSLAFENPNFSDTVKLEAGLMALISAKQLKDKKRYKDLWNKVQVFSLEEDVKANLHLSYIDLLKKEENSEELALVTEQFLVDFPNYKEPRCIQLTQIHALCKSNQWEAAKTALHNFIQAYPEHVSAELRRLQMDCFSKLLEKNPSYRNEWIALAKSTLQIPSLLSSEEKEHYHLELAKNLFLEGQFSEALCTTAEFLTEFSSSSSLEEAELLQVLCYLEDKESHLLFALHAEKFLEHYPQNMQAPIVRIHLFNSYLEQATFSQGPLRSELLDKAASHLYVVFEQKQHPIQKENTQWLADYYYSSSSTDKAIVLFEALLENPTYQAKTEENVYKLSNLLSKNLAFEKKAVLLERWITDKASLQTPLQKHFIFDLAGTYKKLNNLEKALSLYDLLILSTGHSKIGAESNLERCKILFSRLSEEEKVEENVSYMDIVHSLKDLENQKNISSEPLHLEAALEYIECRTSSIKDPTLRKQKMQELLRLCQESFNSAYEAKDLEGKEEMFLAYKQFIEAKMLLCEPQLEGNKEKSFSLLKLLQENPLTPSTLQDRIKNSLELDIAL